MSFEEVKAYLSASFSGGLFNADSEVLRSDSLNMEAKSKTMLSQTTVHWCGGSRDLHMKDAITNRDKMSKWKLSLGENPTMLTTEICLEPVSTAISCLILLLYIILNLPQFTNDLQIHLKYMY